MQSSQTNSETSRPEIQRLVLTLKSLMKRKGFHYQDLAAVLDVSLPTVKRAMASSELGFDRLLKACDWLGVSFYQLVELSRAGDDEALTLSGEQEEFFADNPGHLAYFLALRAAGANAEAVQKRHGLTDKSTRAYLKALEEIGLVERWPNGKVKLTSRAAQLVWDDRGPLGRTHARSFVRAFARRAVERFTDRPELYLANGSRSLTPEQYAAFRQDLDDLVKKYRAVSQLNSVAPLTGTRRVSFLLIADEWEFPYLNTIENLA